MSKSASQTPNMTRKFASKASSNTSGCIDDDFFYNYFESIESKQISSVKELQDVISEVQVGLKKGGEDWEKKIKCLKMLQTVTVAGSGFEEFCGPLLRQLHICLQLSLGDLRSQVVREACLTVGFLAHSLKNQCELLADSVMPSLFGLVPNSAKVMASSGCVCVDIIVTNIQSSKILSHIINAMSSKSNSTRRFASKLLVSVCGQWDAAIAERAGLVPGLAAAVDRGTADADQETRAHSRRALAGLADQWPGEARSLLLGMDAGRRSLVERELRPELLAGLLPTAAAMGRRTSCPPTTLRMGTAPRGGRQQPGDSSSTTAAAYSSLNRPRVKTSATRTTSGSKNGANIMTMSAMKAESSTSKMRGSNSSLTSSYSTRSNTRTTPQTSRKNNDVTSNGPTYKYKSSTGGSVSASLPRRKNMATKGISYPASGDSNGMAAALQLPGRYQREGSNASSQYRRRYDNSSDDNASETSSLESSELSRSSSRAQRPTDNVAEMIRQVASTYWTDKKDGLINLQNFLQSGRLSPVEVKKVVEILNPLFTETKSKIFPLFLVTVQLLVESHSKYLSDWLFSLIMNLITRQAAETSSSRLKPLQDTLAVVRSQFSMDLLVREGCRMVCDVQQHYASSSRIKSATVAFMKTLVIVAPSSALEQCLSGLTPGVAVLLEWAVDSKWQDLRKVASALIVKLSELHPDIFESVSHCLSVVVRQKIATVVKQQQPNGGDHHNGRLKPRDTYASTGRVRSRTSSGLSSTPVVMPPQPGMPTAAGGQMSQEDIDSYIRRNTEDLQALSVAYDRYGDETGLHAYGSSSGLYSKSGLPQRQIPQPQYRSQFSDPAAANPTITATGEPPALAGRMGLYDDQAAYMIGRYQSSMRAHPAAAPTMLAPVGYGPPDNGGGGGGYSSAVAFDTGSNYGGSNYGYAGANTSIGSLPDAIYPSNYSGVAGLDIFLQNPASLGFQMLQKMSEMPPNDMMISILAELCNINQRTEQRKACLLKMIGLIRESAVDAWNDLFKTTLMRLLETVKDSDADIRAHSLRVILELTKAESSRFEEYTHLTVLRLLQAHKDSDKTVVRTAEECGQAAVRYLNPSLCVRVLAETITEPDCRVGLAALKMLLELLRAVPEPFLHSVLPSLVPGLTRTSEHEESHIRKASIFCLVEVHRRIGDDIWGYLTTLTSSKARLLRLYIDKNRSGSRMTESTSGYA